MLHLESQCSLWSHSAHSGVTVLHCPVTVLHFDLTFLLCDVRVLHSVVSVLYSNTHTYITYTHTCTQLFFVVVFVCFVFCLFVLSFPKQGFSV